MSASRPDAFSASVFDTDGETRGLWPVMSGFLICMPLILTGFLAAGVAASAPLSSNMPMSVGLTELARFAGDARLAQMSKAHWNLSLFWMAAGTALFVWRGIISERRQGWSEGVWIGVVAAICVGVALFERSGGAGLLDQSLDRLRSLSAETAPPMEPRAALVMRTIWLTLIGGLAAVAAHDLAYRTRRTLEEFDLITPPDFTPMRFPDDGPLRGPKAGPQNSGASPSSEAGFGQRQTPPPEMPRGEGMTRGEALLTLGLTTTATKKEIGRAFHAAMKTAHPDRGGSTARAARVNTARDILLGKRR
jgi:hypothetical protein